MQAFLAGLGFEGTDTFLSILHAEPLLRDGALPITQDLVSFSVKDGHYDARARVLIRHVSCLLRVTQQQLEDFEETLGEKLREAGEESEEESSRRQKKERGRKLRRYLLIGLATVGGGTVIGVTGGLAAPLVAAGAGAVLGAGGAAVLGSATGIAIMASLFGAAGAGLTGIVTALTWPASLLAVASVIDNPWGVCLSRSAEVGKHLAQVLRSRQQGKRPVNLIGFSLGARVIYFCLEELANDQGSEGVVEDVVLLGAPVDGGDWLLGFLYRSSSVRLSVAGLQPINSQDRKIINVDLSSVVKGHLDYMRQMDTILVAVGVPTREEAGAMSGKLQLVHLSQEKTGTPESAGQKGEPSIDSSNQDTSEANVDEYKKQTQERGERKDSENGWDIPDISDLLDSIGECDGVLEACQGNARSPCALGVKDHVEPSQDQGKTNKDEGETDCEHTSWDWDDTNWTTESTNTTYQLHTEAREQIINGKPACSEPRVKKS
ncbi:transmembrane and coiled-coil domain-containing 4-like protein [Labeo rohita]|uniref:Transmembrane and coiled-coil domain-containing 4-like protein n=1 Tax=Labeo rohita TaxID=84645 RepID=A0A498LS46_LABRO|nr:transmembrane and coiled-coil domain-containing 4-like protein [Labeo rohita]